MAEGGGAGEIDIETKNIHVNAHAQDSAAADECSINVFDLCRKKPGLLTPSFREVIQGVQTGSAVSGLPAARGAVARARRCAPGRPWLAGTARC